MVSRRSDGGSGGNVRQLTAEEKVYAATYLNETDEDRASVVAEIRRWIEESDDLCARTGKYIYISFSFFLCFVLYREGGRKGGRRVLFKELRSPKSKSPRVVARHVLTDRSSVRSFRFFH